MSDQNKTFIKTFTTRVDTIFSVSFLAVAPEYPDLFKLVKDFQKQEVEEYLQKVKNKSERERQINKDKTGVWTGSYAKNPLTGDLVPIFVADYVLAGYGTGAVMGVPGHDHRDYEFVSVINQDLQKKAKQANLPLLKILKNVAETSEGIQQQNTQSSLEVFTQDGYLFNSGEFSGLSSSQAREKITAKLVENNQGKKSVNYKFRDWIFSRQRYWGEPFPFEYIQENLYKDNQ